MESITSLLDDPKQKENFIFLILGVMLGVFLSIMRHYLCDSPDKKERKQVKS